MSKYRGGYQGWTPAPVVAGKCSKHGTLVGEITRICFACHDEALLEAGVDLTDHRKAMESFESEATGFNRARLL